MAWAGSVGGVGADESAILGAGGAGVSVAYQLPTDGPLPRAYRVTLAAAPADRPDWLVSTFVSGAVRMVTDENAGRFTDNWDGLDDNQMPVPPGSYVIRAIYTQAVPWPADGQHHALRLNYRLAAGDSWAPSPDQADKLPWIYGHVFGPIRDISVGPNGRAAFWGQYIENAWNPFLADLNRPIGYDQVLERFPSGGTGGGEAVACDGLRIWCASDIGGKPYIHSPRQGNPFAPVADGFGQDRNAYGVQCRLLPVKAVSLALAYRDDSEPVLWATQGAPEHKLLALDSRTGETLARVEAHEPLAVCVDRTVGRLLVLHQNQNGRAAIAAVALRDGLPAGGVEPWFELEGDEVPSDLEIDGAGRLWVCWPESSRVSRVGEDGRIERLIGSGRPPEPGLYDDRVFYRPLRLAVWRDAGGKDRLLVIESDGPHRISEWDPSDGSLLRQWFLTQHAHSGYCLDPREPTHLYVASPLFITRFVIDPDKGEWRVGAVWPKTLKGHLYPLIRVVSGRKYLTFAGGLASGFHHSIYRLKGDRLTASAGVVPDATLPEGEAIRRGFWWHDADGDGRVEPEEYTGLANLPAMSYWGDVFLEDLTLAVLKEDTVFAGLTPTGFDAHHNPIYDGSKWRTLVRDPVGTPAAGPKPPLDGGNELRPWGVHWIGLRDDAAGGYYLADSFGPSNPGGIDTAGNYFAQVKLSRLVPDADGGHRILWRVGRKAPRLAEPGQMYSSHYLTGPAHGLVGIFDSNGLYHVFTDRGLFVDTLGLDTFRHGIDRSGVFGHSGESWYGSHFLDPRTGKVYLLMGRAQCTVYEVEGWSPGLVHELTVDPAVVNLAAGDIAPPSPWAMELRGGKRTIPEIACKLAVKPPGLTDADPAWDAADPAWFELDEQRSARVNCLFDRDHIYLRWRVRLPDAVRPADVTEPQRLFTHERGADTFSFYFQGDPEAGSGGEAGRPDDARLVFAVTRRGDELIPVALGMYPAAPAGVEARPITYFSPVRTESFGHVVLLDQVRMVLEVAPDQRSMTLTAAIPRSVLPGRWPFEPGRVTRCNWEVTLAGRTKFWWSNVAGLTLTNTTDEPSEAALYPGSWGNLRFVE